MDTTSLGFYVKPRLYVLENGNIINDGKQLLEKKSKNVDLYYMSDGFFVVKKTMKMILIWMKNTSSFRYQMRLYQQTDRIFTLLKIVANLLQWNLKRFKKI